MLIEDNLLKLWSGSKVEKGEVSNKVEKAVVKGEMLLNLIRIWWKCGPWVYLSGSALTQKESPNGMAQD